MSLKQRIISRSSWFSLQYSIESALLGVSNDLLMSVDSGNFDLILVQRPRATAYTRAWRVKGLREWRGLHSTTAPLDAPLNPTHSSFNCDFLLAAKSPERYENLPQSFLSGPSDMTFLQASACVFPQTSLASRAASPIYRL